MKFSNLSLKKQFYFVMFSIGIAIMLAGFSFNILSTYKYREISFIQKNNLQTGLIADSALAPLMFFDKDGISSSLEQ